MFGTNGGIIEASRDGVGEGDLPVRILQHVRECSLQHARNTALKTGSVLSQCSAAAAGFHADKPYLAVGNEFVECADGVRSATYRGDDNRWQLAFLLQNLLLHLNADAAMEVAHHGGVGMRAESAAEEIVGGTDVGDPVAHGLADGVFQ